MRRPCDHANAERLSVCCGARELGEESDLCADCRDHTGFDLVCECGEVLPDPRYAARGPLDPGGLGPDITAMRQAEIKKLCQSTMMPPEPEEVYRADN